MENSNDPAPVLLMANLLRLMTAQVMQMLVLKERCFFLFFSLNRVGRIPFALIIYRIFASGDEGHRSV